VADPEDPRGITNITVSSSRFHTGSHSLAVTMAIAAYSTNDSRGVVVVVPLCASSGIVNLVGYSVSAWVYVVVTSGSIPMNAANLIQQILFTKDASGFTVDGSIPVSQSNTNQWIHVQGTITQSDSTTYELAISLGFAIASPTSEGFTGTMYIDDVQITPP